MVLQSTDYIALDRIKKLLLFIQFLNAFIGFACRHFDNVANKLAVSHCAHNPAIQLFQGIADFILI